MGLTTWGEPLSGIEQPTAIEIADGVRVKVVKHTITTVLNKTEPATN